MLDIGRVCIKTAGREAGRACVIIDTIDETYVMITGPKSLTKVRRRKCNIDHLEPLEFQLKLAKNAGDTEVARLLQAEKILDKLTSGKPVGRPGMLRKEKAPGEEAEAKNQKKSLRERFLGRVKKEETPREEKKSAEKKPEKKPEKREKKPEKKRKPAKPKKRHRAKRAKHRKKPQSKKK